MDWKLLHRRSSPSGCLRSSEEARGSLCLYGQAHYDTNLSRIGQFPDSSQRRSPQLKDAKDFKVCGSRRGSSRANGLASMSLGAGFTQGKDRLLDADSVKFPSVSWYRDASSQWRSRDARYRHMMRFHPPVVVGIAILVCLVKKSSVTMCSSFYIEHMLRRRYTRAAQGRN